ncbi:MAG: c-type cytochrome [Sandaracinaceae bacterium]|nr:c-type cytochrome [Sandaracinaceae bacterium]
MRLGLFFIVCLSACSNAAPSEPAIADGIFAPLGRPLPGLSAEDAAAFERGRLVALRQFTPADGLGPSINATSCGGCHERPALGGASGRYRNFLMVGKFREPDHGFEPLGSNGDAQEYSLVDGREPSDPETVVTATRHAIPFFGTGLLSEIPDAELRSREDPYDSDHDGISGIANVDHDLVGRFGRKAQNVTIEQFVRGPMFNHMGLTSLGLTDADRAALPIPIVGPPSSDVADDDGVSDPELARGDIVDLMSFALLLAAPTPDAPTVQSERGRGFFADAHCTSCHVASLAGPRGGIPAYTDLLLHDMGPELADGIVQGFAIAYEYRTQPLWGVAAAGPYLHDGRADTLDEAIRAHGGEAAQARDAYVAMAPDARDDLVEFLLSLGGRNTRGTGTVPSGTLVGEVGSYGGPVAGLLETPIADFLAGREVFDRDFGFGVGLGPLFNGDSCRGCHSTPTIGGAGAFDVNVVRHGMLDTDGAFTAPTIGTIAHRHSVDGSVRGAFDDTANVIELRQTPAIYGLGRIELIGDDTIRAAEDADDLNGDGISGRAHILADGRLGRFGWKAQIPDLDEFARDALSAEMGITLPVQDGRVFGTLRDDDEFADPEVSIEDVRTLVAYMRTLAPPPRTHHDIAREAQGELMFTTFGCASCHTPLLPTRMGMPVPLYSDVLLHDVASPEARGITDGNATPREFRTAPLWGLAQTAPYMHDGRAFTIEDAIAAHDAEAATARAAVSSASAEDRAALVAFLSSL